MKKTILITGSTDGIGLETAKKLAASGHNVLLHGRKTEKLEAARKELSAAADGKEVECYKADLSNIPDVKKLSESVAKHHDKLDVLINNAGVFKSVVADTQDNLDIRFVVNTIAPYLLTKLLLPLIGTDGRIINISSAAQAPVDLEALSGKHKLKLDMESYSQSKLALNMWSNHMARELKDGPAVISVNPGSLLATKMVKEGFGIDGKDILIGADILERSALDDEFSVKFSGKYFDNDADAYGAPHKDALDAGKCGEVVRTIDETLAGISSRS